MFAYLIFKISKESLNKIQRNSDLSQIKQPMIHFVYR